MHCLQTHIAREVHLLLKDCMLLLAGWNIDMIFGFICCCHHIALLIYYVTVMCTVFESEVLSGPFGSLCVSIYSVM